MVHSNKGRIKRRLFSKPQLCISLAIFGLLLFLPRVVGAQGVTEIAVTPAIVDAPVEPGRAIERKIQITNGSESALPISIEVQSAVIDGQPLEEGSMERYDVSDWVRFAESTYVFEPGQTREIPFTITAPFTADAGGHYAHISIRSLVLESGGDSARQGLVFPEIGVPVLMTVPGEIVEDARIMEGSLFPLISHTGDAVGLEIPIENRGTVHNLVSGKLVIEQDGKTVDEQRLQATVLLPSTRKTIEHEWIVPGGGKYQAYVELSYGTSQQTVRSNHEVIYVTPKLEALVFGALSVWLLLYIYPRRKNIHDALKVLYKKA